MDVEFYLKFFCPDLKYYSTFCWCHVPHWQAFVYSNCFSNANPTLSSWDKPIQMLMYFLHIATFHLCLLAFCICVWVRQAHHSPRSWSPGQLVTLTAGRGNGVESTGSPGPDSHWPKDLRSSPLGNWGALPLAATGCNSSKSRTGWEEPGDTRWCQVWAGVHTTKPGKASISASETGWLGPPVTQ